MEKRRASQLKRESMVRTRMVWELRRMWAAARKESGRAFPPDHSRIRASISRQRAGEKTIRAASEMIRCCISAAALRVKATVRIRESSPSPREAARWR
jgi:hypothetical protein